MTKQEIQAQIIEANKQLEVAKADVSKASCAYKKAKNQIAKLYEAHFLAPDSEAKKKA